MYRRIKDISNVEYINVIVPFSKGRFYVVDKNEEDIRAYDLEDLNLQWQTRNKDYTCRIINNTIVATDLRLYDLDGKSIFENSSSEWYELEFYNEKNLVVYKTVNEEKKTVLYHIFDLTQKQFYLKNIEAKYPEMFIKDGFFICTDKGKISLYNYNTQNEVWQQDLSEITSYKDWWGEHKGEVKRVYSYKDKVILTAGDSVLSLDLETGKRLWQVRYNSLDFTPLTLHIVNNVAYLSKGAYYSAIDLDKGVKLVEIMLQRPFDLDSQYWQANLAMVGSDMTFHEGYFYFSDRDKDRKHYFLAKMKPETGIIEDYQILDGITSNLAPPKFYNDKMFLLDSRTTLHIYEKE